MNVDKNKSISDSLKQTRLKRQFQKCKVFELKIQENHLNLKQKECLKMMFVEAKWLYNNVIASDDVFKYDYKNKTVNVLDKDKNIETKELKYLPAINRQVVIKLTQQNIVNLSKAKKKGLSVGKLKFKSDYNTIDLSQNGSTHKIISKNKIKINGIKKHLYVNGLNQIKDTYEIANAKLIKKPSGYFIKLVTYEFIKSEEIIENKSSIGLDFGINNNITTSDGDVFQCSIRETERLKRLQLRISKKQKGSKNRFKERLKLQKEYEYMFNCKKDAANKVVNFLLTNYNRVYMQDEQIDGWKNPNFKDDPYNKKKDYNCEVIQHSYLGLVKGKLKKESQTFLLDKYQATTKLCYNCGKYNDIGSNDVYKCECGLIEQRDIKAAKTAKHIGKCLNNYVPMERRESKPVESHSAL